ncbi:hypothetical protein Smic_33610 [Streptomyces microflavus]|uniref:Uncharacterized protein n=1 Tax=Streptomyces microflavus TaxID=1919 RepID=A0A7J0CSZ7_STRMI|nr:hypothetical protein Smic_33610 [Streptomyces microflavus]
MIANVSAHRRANAFAQALEEQNPQGAAAVQPEEPADQADPGPLLALANGLGELPKPQLDPEVKVVQRAQLVAAMEAMFAEGGASTGPTVPVQRGKGPTGPHHCANCVPAPAGRKGSPPVGSPWVWQPARSAEWPLPAPTPCPVTRCTG